MTEIEILQETANQINSDFQAVKSAIVDSGVEVPEGTRTQDYGAKVRKVYDNGKQAQYDAFWDAYQQSGERIDYSRAFGGNGWTTDFFKPKYDMMCLRCDNMFNYATKLKIDLVEWLSNLGIVLDTSRAGLMTSMFEWSSIQRVGVIDLTSATSTSNLFNNATSLHTIDKLVLPTDRDLAIANGFLKCTALKNITIEGKIRYNFDFKDCPLTRASIESVMNALSTDASGYAVTFNKDAVIAAFGSTDSAEWEALKATRDTWTISLSPT